MFTQKDYKAIAEIIRKTYTSYDLTYRNITRRFADYFAEDNPRFNRDKFFKACDIE